MVENPEIQSLATAILQAMPPLTESERRLAVTLYRLLAAGAPVATRDLGRSAEISEAEVSRILDAWPGVFRDDQNRVVGFWGLAIPEMAHRLELGRVRLHTWCAWDALFITPLLGRTARAISRDPITGATISMTVTPSGVEDLSHPDAVVSFLTPDKPWDHSVIQGFCHFVLFFENRASGGRWTADHPGALLLSVSDAFELGRLTNAGQFGSVTAQPGTIG